MRGPAAVLLLLLGTSSAWAAPIPDPASRALVQLVVDGRSQAALARLGRARAVRADVRAYAARVAEDAREVERAVRARLVWSPRWRRDRSDDEDRLRALPREDFDVAFLTVMAERQAGTVELATTALATAEPGTARDLLARVVPVLRQDMRLARLLGAVA